MSEINWNWSNAHTLQTHHNQVHSKNLLQSTYFKKASKLSKKVKVAYTRLPSVGFQSWSRFLAVSLQVMWVINPAVDCHYCLQLPSQPLRGLLLPVLLLGEQRHNGCEQFAQDCYPTASRLRFEPRPSAPESSSLTTRLPSHPKFLKFFSLAGRLLLPGTKHTVHVSTLA